MEQGGASSEPRCPSLWIILLHPFQEDVSFSVLDKFNPYINSLGKDLALNFIVYNDARGMLADVVDSSYCYGIYF